MPGGAIAIARPDLNRLRLPTRSAILTGVLLLHAAAILLLLAERTAAPAASAERTLAIFDLVEPPPPPPAPPDPPPSKQPSVVETRPAPAAAKIDPGGSARPPVERARAPVFAPVERVSSFDTTPTLDAPAHAIGAAPLPGLVDGGAGGLGGNGLGQGRGDGAGEGRGGGGGGVGFRKASWIYQPGFQEMMAYFPPAAKEAKLSGKVLLACRVPKAGKPESCKAIAENPQAQGFAEAAVRLSARFRIRPGLRDQAVMTDLAIIIPITFTLKGATPAAWPACPPAYCHDVTGYREALAAGRVK